MNIDTRPDIDGIRGWSQLGNNKRSRNDNGLCIELDALLDRTVVPTGQLTAVSCGRRVVGSLCVIMMRRGFVLSRVGRIWFRLRRCRS